MYDAVSIRDCIATNGWVLGEFGKEAVEAKLRHLPGDTAKNNETLHLGQLKSLDPLRTRDNFIDAPCLHFIHLPSTLKSWQLTPTLNMKLLSRLSRALSPVALLRQLH